MSDRTQNAGSHDDQRLFKHTDEQERVYAPQQLPSEARDEVGAGGAWDAAGTEPIVPGTPTTAINTPIPGAKAIDPLDRDDDAMQSRER